MTDKLKNALQRALDELPHPDLQEIASQPVEKLTAHDHITRQPERKKRRFALPPAAMAACASLALFLLLGGSWYTQNRVISTIVDLDVNPSFEITVNRKDNVLAVTGLNDDARDILDGRNYRGWDIADTVDTLVLSMAQSSHIRPDQNAVLLSVSSKDPQHGQELQQTLILHIDQTLQQAGITPHIVTQTLYDSQSLSQQAQALEISPGKLQYIQTLTNDDGPSAAALAQLSIQELLQLQHSDRDDDDWDDDLDDRYDDDRYDGLDDQDDDDGRYDDLDDQDDDRYDDLDDQSDDDRYDDLDDQDDDRYDDLDDQNGDDRYDDLDDQSDDDRYDDLDDQNDDDRYDDLDDQNGDDRYDDLDDQNGDDRYDDLDDQNDDDRYDDLDDQNDDDDDWNGDDQDDDDDDDD